MTLTQVRRTRTVALRKLAAEEARIPELLAMGIREDCFLIRGMREAVDAYRDLVAACDEVDPR